VLIRKEEKKMKYSECLIFWNRPKNGDSGEVLVTAHPASESIHLKFDSSGGAAFAYIHGLTEVGSIVDVQAEFITMVLQHGFAPQIVHKEFMKIDEYAITRRHDFYGVLGDAKTWPETYWDVFVKPDHRDQIKALSRID
jgi:hypothetical protein